MSAFQELRQSPLNRGAQGNLRTSKLAELVQREAWNAALAVLTELLARKRAEYPEQIPADENSGFCTGLQFAQEVAAALAEPPSPEEVAAIQMVQLIQQQKEKQR